jgi:RES domain
MIVFRQADARYPFVWESADQPPARWHAPGDGPAHYFADTPDGAWAEFLRHEEITDPADLATVRRRMWAIEIPDEPGVPVRLAHAVLTGGPATYARCQAAAARLRAAGARRLIAPSAALLDGGAAGTIVHDGPQRGAPRDGVVIVLFGAPDGLLGWTAGDAARPLEDLLPRVRYFADR